MTACVTAWNEKLGSLRTVPADCGDIVPILDTPGLRVRLGFGRRLNTKAGMELIARTRACKNEVRQEVDRRAVLVAARPSV